MGSGLENWCGKVEANLEELFRLMESSVECRVAPAQPGWGVCHLSDVVKDSNLGVCVLFPHFCHGEAAETEVRFGMTTFFFLCWMFGGKGRGWSLLSLWQVSNHTERCLSWCLPKQRIDRCWWWFSSCLPESCVSEAADLGHPADNSIYRFCPPTLLVSWIRIRSWVGYRTGEVAWDLPWQKNAPKKLSPPKRKPGENKASFVIQLKPSSANRLPISILLDWTNLLHVSKTPLTPSQALLWSAENETKSWVSDKQSSL